MYSLCAEMPRTSGYRSNDVFQHGLSISSFPSIDLNTCMILKFNKTSQLVTNLYTLLDTHTLNIDKAKLLEEF